MFDEIAVVMRGGQRQNPNVRRHPQFEDERRNRNDEKDGKPAGQAA
jgi:hypothetical protein